MSYQGHLADGSSIQKHSAGGLFPYIISAKQHGDKLVWGALEPRGRETFFHTHEAAVQFAQACKARHDAKDYKTRNQYNDAIRIALQAAVDVNQTAN